MSVVFNPFTGNLDFNDTSKAAGSDTQVQFNDGGKLGGDVDLTYNKTTNKLTTGGDVELNDGGSFTTTLQTVTPTAARTISFPDATGTVGLVAGSSGQLISNDAGAYAGISTATVSGGNITLTGRFTSSLNGALDAPPVALTGTWIATGGTATTTKPQFLIEPAGTTSTAWSTAGTGLGVNAASGFTGRLLDLQLNGTSNFNVDSTGRVSFPLGAVGTPSLYPGADTNTGFWSPAADTIAASTGGSERARIDSSGRLLIGTSTSTNNSLLETNISAVTKGDGTLGGIMLTGYNGTTGSTVRSSVLGFQRSRGTTDGSLTLVANGDRLGNIIFRGADGTSFVDAASIQAFVDGTPGANDMPGRLVFSTTADGAISPTERLRITNAGVLQVADAGNISVGTTTGTKIGTATTQKLGFYNATPVVQPTAVADATDAATAITQLNALLARMRDLGLIAT
jgi:hypothetical protein